MSTRASSQNVCFSIPSGATSCGTLLNYEQVKNQLRISIEVDPPTWEMIDLVMLFNLRWDVRKAGSVSGQKPVQIYLALDKILYEELLAKGELLTDKDAFLSAPDNHPMRSNVSWFGLEVTEEVDLPDELKSKGTLREGFTTKWRDDFN